MRERSRDGLPFNVDGHRFMGAVEHELEVARRRGVGAFDTQHAAITGEVRPNSTGPTVTLNGAGIIPEVPSISSPLPVEVI